MPSSNATPRTPAKRILLVDDDNDVAQTIRLALVVAGHAVDIAGDGRQALGMFAAVQYDLVITDFSMAGMDGLELAAAIKNISPKAPIVMLTAYLDLIKGSDGKVSNVDELMGKPCSIPELHRLLQKIFAPS
jgi:two-component system, OmpR family, response regulator